MNFFENIKSQIEEKLNDFSTIEHAMIFEDSKAYIYRIQQTDGDSITIMSEDNINEEYISLFNETFSVSVESRTSIVRILIECLT